MTPSVMTTPRLILEPLSLRHSEAMFRLWSHPEVCRYSGPAVDWRGDPIALPAASAADSDRIVDYFLRKSARGEACRWAIVLKDGGAVVGAAGFNAFQPRAELGFHVSPSWWRQGLAREACETLMDWARRTLGVSGFQAFVDQDNAASIGLLARLGFQEGERYDARTLRFER